MATEELVTYDMHIRYTDDNGAKRVVCHRVWDGERFFSAHMAEAQKARKKDRTSKAAVEMITEQQYRQERA